MTLDMSVMRSSSEIGAGRLFDTTSFASLALLYASGLILSSVIHMTEGKLTFTYAHAFFGFSLLLLAALDRDFRAGIWKPLRYDWAAWALAGFIGYYVIMIFLHPDDSVAAYHMRSLTVRVGVAFLFGYMTFAALSGRTAPTGRVARKWWSGVDAFVLTVYAGVIVFAFWKFMPLIRNDVFLLRVPPDRAMYQLFGNYTLFGLICAVWLTWPYFRSLQRYPVLQAAAWMATVSVASILSFILVQMSGSNLGAALIAVIGGMTGLYIIYTTLRDRNLHGAAAALGVGALAVGLLFSFIVTSPPLRIFGYKPILVEQQVASPRKEEDTAAPAVASSQESSTRPQPHGVAPRSSETTAGNSSAAEVPPSDYEIRMPSLAPSSRDSRAAIFEEEGYKQLSHAPLTGDLGVERIYIGPGGYIHSLVSIQTHLGLVGSVLFLLFLATSMLRAYRRAGNDFLKIVSIPILAAALTSTFFTWMPLWFLLGALYAAGTKVSRTGTNP